MRVILAFAMILFLFYCNARPDGTPLSQAVRKLTLMWTPREDWRKCEQGDTYEDGCGHCICAPNNYFDCSWEHCLAREEEWEQLVLPFEVEDNKMKKDTPPQWEPFFYTVFKHALNNNSTTDPDDKE